MVAALASHSHLGPADAGRTSFTLFMLSPVFHRQKVAQRRWMEASAGNLSMDTALLLICLPRAVVRGRDWDKEGYIVLHPARGWQQVHQNQEGEMSFLPPRMVTLKVMSAIVPFPAAHLDSPYFLKENGTITCCLAFCCQVIEPGCPGQANQPWLEQTPQAPGGCRRDAQKLL